MKLANKIFIIDDDKDQLYYLENLLKDRYDVTTFDNAKSAMLVLDEIEPDIIISDIIMPDIDGFEFAKNYKELYIHRDTIIIFLSAIDDPETICFMLKEGAYDYITKPISEKVLLTKIEKALAYLDEKRSRKIILNLEDSDREKIIDLVSNKYYNSKIIFEENGKVVACFKVFNGEITEDIKNKILNNKGKIVIEHLSLQYDKTFIKSKANKIKGKGLLSKIQIGEKIITIQTEVLSYPQLHIQSIADLNGKILDKIIFNVDEDWDEQTLGEKISELHNRLENRIKEKILSKLNQNKREEKDFITLLEEGFDRYRENDFEGALRIWREAKRLKPDDKILEVNINILMKKLNK